jgi:fimbrial chaperone protein
MLRQQNLPGAVRWSIATLCMMWSLVASAGALRVGPTRIELSVKRPVVTLEVQNTTETSTLAQIDVFSWTQMGGDDVLVPTTDLIATPLVLNLAPGETRVVRVGLRQPNRDPIEQNYRLFVREVPPAFSSGPGLQFAVRIGVPVFVLPVDRPGAVHASEMGWRWITDIDHCMAVQLSNPATRHERVFAAEILSRDGELLWRSSDPVYVLAGSSRIVRPTLCPPGLKQAVTLRLQTESGILNLPVEAPSMLVDANSH